jgi:PAS domain S-box-containing protein
VNLSQLNRILLQTLLLPVVALLLVSGALVWQLGNAEKTVADLRDADHNIATATYILAQTVDEESGLRGFQNTSNEAFLEPFQNAQGLLTTSVTSLRKDLASHGKDTQLLDQFVAAHRLWLDSVASPMIALVRSGGDTRDVALNLRGKDQMDHLRALVNELIDEQKLQRQDEVEHWQTQVRHTLEAIVSCAALLGLLIGLFARSRLHMVTQAFQGAITALRKNAQATYDSEQRLRTTLTSIGDGVIVCDQQGRVELLNTVAEQLTGWTQAEAAQCPISEVFLIVDEPTRELMENPVDAALRTHRAVSLANHAILLRRGGGEIQIDDSGAPIFDRSGELAGVVMVFRDVTEQRRTQAALLASEKLAVTGRLAATLAHEIHNPLDSVVNLLYLMKNGATPEEMREFLDLARSELDRVTQISRAMLGMYRESKTPIEIDLKELLDSILLLLQRQITDAGITLQKNLADDAKISGYPAELRQVFTNLFTNAMDASSPGSAIEVSLRYTPSLDGQRSRNSSSAGVTVSVVDHGPGIPSETIKHLFQPFFTTKGEKGTGLGLWVSQGIVQRHGGDIRLESRTDDPNHGTTVSVFLPETPVDVPTPEPATPQA